MKAKKVILYIMLLSFIGAIGAWYYGFVYSKNNHRDVAKETSIIIGTNELHQAFIDDENLANNLYLDKAVEVQGTVSEVSSNQDGFPIISLSTNDIFATIDCTLKENKTVEIGSAVTVKGICIGFTGNVKIKDAYLK